jgi:hypothetical protein
LRHVFKTPVSKKQVFGMRKHDAYDVLHMFLSSIIIASFGIMARAIFPNNNMVMFTTMHLVSVWTGVIVSKVEVTWGYLLAMVIPSLGYTLVGAFIIVQSTMAFLQSICTLMMTSFNGLFSCVDDTETNDNK